MKRIQRKRTKGWMMPENTVYVGRPSKWGNPYVRDSNAVFFINPNTGEKRFLEAKSTVAEAKAFVVQRYRIKVANCFSKKELQSLKGKNLACWCKEGEPCHADVLLEIVNQNPASK